MLIIWNFLWSLAVRTKCPRGPHVWAPWTKPTITSWLPKQAQFINRNCMVFIFFWKNLIKENFAPRIKHQAKPHDAAFNSASNRHTHSNIVHAEDIPALIHVLFQITILNIQKNVFIGCWTAESFRQSSQNHSWSVSHTTKEGASK